MFYTPEKLTRPLNRNYFRREHIFQPLIFRCYASFQGVYLGFFVNWGVALFLLVQTSFLRKTIMEAHIFQEVVRFQDFPTERDGTFWNDPWVWVISIHNLPSCEVTYLLPRHF